MGRCRLHIAHFSNEFIGACEHREWSSIEVVNKYRDEIANQMKLREDMHNISTKIMIFMIK